MTKLGWTILALIVLVVGGFVSLLTFGRIERRERAAVAAVPTAVTAPAGLLAVPVAGYPRGAIRDSWGDARGGGTRAHHGTDIMAAGGTPVVAAASGVVEKLFASHDGGTTIYVRSPDRRWSYYYAHLAGYAPGLHEGQAVRAGERIGFVGDTGNAGPGNTHLHFGLSRMEPRDGWYGGTPVNPYRLLAGRDAAR
jgi:peptidoglycan LD-endopeptidase LytH